MKSIKLTTPIGKAIYPKFQPDYFFDKKGIYSCKLHVSKEDFEAFSKQVDAHVEKAFEAECEKQGKKLKRSSHTPLLITEEGDFEIRTKQPAKVETAKGEIEFSVALYDSQGQKLAPDTNVGSGSLVRCNVEVSTWYVTSQGFGYTLRLRAAQIIELVEYSGGKKDDGFGAVDGGYIAEEEYNEEKNEESKEANQASTAEVPF